VLSKVSRDVHEIQVRYVSQSQSTTGRLTPVSDDHIGVLPSPGLVQFRFLTKLLTGFATGGRLCPTDDDDRSEHAAGEDQAAYRKKTQHEATTSTCDAAAAATTTTAAAAAAFNH